MEKKDSYLMEDPEEALRLDVKTVPAMVIKQAKQCGIGSGARVLDGGCGSGKTTSILHELVQPGGEVVGVDFAADRIDFAKKHYEGPDGIAFHEMDLRNPLDSLGQFDFIWIRFVLEYYLIGATDIIKNVSTILKPDGSLCLLDLDYNCLSHYPLPREMEEILHKLVNRMVDRYNFDPYIGRKLYSYQYDLGFRDIQLHLMAQHLIYGEIKPGDDFNWIKKVQMASVKAPDLFEGYPGGYDGFFHDFKEFFRDPRRFTYTPLIACIGKRPLSDA